MNSTSRSKAGRFFAGMMLGTWITTASVGCSNATDPAPVTRTYRMGFSHIPPRLSVASVLATLDAWEPRADAGIMAITPPWRSLLADTTPSFLIRREYLQIIERYRARGFTVVVMIDPTDGFKRDSEAPELLALGRSIAEPAIRALFREFAVAVDSILRPDYLAVSMETNLVRAIAPPALYANLRTM